jgi:hypothetical protein
MFREILKRPGDHCGGGNVLGMTDALYGGCWKWRQVNGARELSRFPHTPQDMSPGNAAQLLSALASPAWKREFLRTTENDLGCPPPSQFGGLLKLPAHAT